MLHGAVLLCEPLGSRLPCAVHRQRPVCGGTCSEAGQYIRLQKQLPRSAVQAFPLPGCPPYRTVVTPVSWVPLGHLGWVCVLNFIVCLLIWFSPALKAHEEEVKKKFRPIEQLKEEFEKLNVKMETDYEIMDKLISKFNSSASTLDEKVAALYDLEYYVHQVTKTHLYLPCKIQGLRYHKCGFIFLISIR